MNDLLLLSQQPHILYAIIFAAALCLVLGMASLLQPARTEAPSVRRARPMQWAATNLSAAFVPSQIEKRETLRLWLLQAGYGAPRAVEIYFGIRLLLSLALAAVTILLLPFYSALPRNYVLSATLVAALVGFLLPLYIVRTQRVARQRKFQEGLPDVLDLLLVCSEAGLGIDMAILTVGEELQEPHPLLARELQEVSTALRAGRERKDAMRGFAESTGIDETVSLVNLLIQSDTLGTSMAQTLRAFSEDMRGRRMLRAEEQGHKVATKLTIVLVAFFLPAIFAALLAPAVFSAVKTMQILGRLHSW